MAAHESPRTTKLYDRTKERLTLDEVVIEVIGQKTGVEPGWGAGPPEPGEAADSPPTTGYADNEIKIPPTCHHGECRRKIRVTRPIGTKKRKVINQSINIPTFFS